MSSWEICWSRYPDLSLRSRSFRRVERTQPWLNDPSEDSILLWNDPKVRIAGLPETDALTVEEVAPFHVPDTCADAAVQQSCVAADFCPTCRRRDALLVIGEVTYCVACGYASDGARGCT